MAEAAIGTAIVQQVGSEIIKHMGSAAWKKKMFGSDLETQIGGLRHMKSFIEAALRHKDPFEVGTDVEGHKIQKLRAVNDRLGYLLDELAARITRQEVMGGKKLVKKIPLFCSSSNQLTTSWSTAERIKSIKKELEDIATGYDMVSSNNVISSSVGNPYRGFNQIDCPLLNPVVIGRDRDRDKIISQLCDSAQELVYDKLDENLKRCIVYCCLFPKTSFNRYEMILYWIALGFVDTGNQKRLEEAGEEHVNSLRRHGCLLEDTGDLRYWGSHFRINDVMHHLLASIGKSKHQMINSTTKEITEGVSHVSLCLDEVHEDDFEDVPLSKLKDGQSLESILFLRTRKTAPTNARLGLTIEKLASRFPNLKVLNLSFQGMEIVPSSIGELIHLRHLDLSKNPLRKLPDSITKLNLLSLILKSCSKLQELPRDTGKLVSLRHLWVDFTDLRRMPKGFGSLTELRSLDMFVVEGKKGSVGATLGELSHLDNLKGELSIRVNGESKYVVSEAREAQMENKIGLTGLNIVFGKSALEDEMCLESLQPSGENLKRLMISNYGGKKLPSWMTDDRFPERFPKLVYMSLEYREFEYLRMDKDSFEMRTENNEWGLLEWVPGYSRLMEQLKTGPIKLRLDLEGGNMLPTIRKFARGSATLIIEKQLEPRSGGGSGQDILFKACFPNLHKLILKDIPELEVLPEEFRDLSSLKILLIEKCPKLKELPCWIDSFSSLETLFIEGAKQLTTMPDSIGNLTSLIELFLPDCSLEWLPYRMINLSSQCSIHIGCSATLFEECQRQTGEYCDLIQHLSHLHLEPPKGFRFLCLDNF